MLRTPYFSTTIYLEMGIKSFCNVSVIEPFFFTQEKLFYLKALSPSSLLHTHILLCPSKSYLKHLRARCCKNVSKIAVLSGTISWEPTNLQKQVKPGFTNYQPRFSHYFYQKICSKKFKKNCKQKLQVTSNNFKYLTILPKNTKKT